MPVGNSEQGVGMWKGQMMLTIDNSFQYIDWSHSAIGNEPFDHVGDMSSYTSNLGFSLGLSDYWNFHLSQIIAYRHMHWDPDEISVHHRDEDSSKDFLNAIGGYLGDTQLNLKYLHQNAGKGPGKRVVFGIGVIVPSKNVLTADPFKTDENGVYTEHRHFAISDGTYKGRAEVQYYIKRSKAPYFIGTSIVYTKPLNRSDYDFMPSDILNISFTSFFGHFKPLKDTAWGFNISYSKTTDAKWGDSIAPNSKGSIIQPGISFIKPFGSGTVTLAIIKPIFLSGDFGGSDSSQDQDPSYEQSTNVWQINIGYRKIFDALFPLLDN